MPQGKEDVTSAALRVAPLDEATWDDFEALLGKSGGDSGCWDMYWRVTSTAYRSMLAEQRRAAIRELASGGGPLGVVAYDSSGECVAWCSAGPRDGYERLVRSRDFRGLLSGADADVWSIICFFLTPRARRRGLARDVIAGVVEWARQSGARAVEAYPADSLAPKLTSAVAFHGTTKMFESCGFESRGKSGSFAGGLPRHVMRLELA